MHLFRLEEVFEKCQTKIPPTTSRPSSNVAGSQGGFGTQSIDEPDFRRLKPRTATNNFVRPLAAISKPNAATVGPASKPCQSKPPSDTQQHSKQPRKQLVQPQPRREPQIHAEPPQPTESRAQHAPPQRKVPPQFACEPPRCKPGEQVMPSSLLSARRPLLYNGKHASTAFQKETRPPAKKVLAGQPQMKTTGEKSSSGALVTSAKPAASAPKGSSSPPIDRRSIFINHPFPLNHREESDAILGHRARADM
jgi:hypothetical protein